MNGGFSILALDGGRARGIYGAQILSRIENARQTRIKDCFDLIAGTSTGSILAGAAAADIPMANVVELFENESPRIFRKKWYTPGISKLLPLLLRGCRQKSLLQIITARSWQMAKYDAVLLA